MSLIPVVLSFSDAIVILDETWSEIAASNIAIITGAIFKHHLLSLQKYESGGYMSAPC